MMSKSSLLSIEVSFICELCDRGTVTYFELSASEVRMEAGSRLSAGSKVLPSLGIRTSREVRFSQLQLRSRNVTF